MAEIKSVQRGTAVILISNTTATATITAVDTTKAFIVFSSRVDSGTEQDGGRAAVSGYISSSTQVSFQRNASGGSTDCTISWMVIEYYSGISVQRGGITGTFNAASSPTAVTLTAVTVAHSWAMMHSSASASWSYSSDQLVTAEITSTTNLNIVSQSTGSPPTGNWRWEVVDHSDATVQKATGTQADGTITTDITISSVDTTKTFIMGMMCRSAGYLDMTYGPSWLLLNSTTMRFYRFSSFTDNSYVLYAVTLPKNISVQRGETTNTGGTTFTQAISTVNLNTTFVQLLAPNGHLSRATAGGTSNTQANHIEAKFNSSTQLNFQRDYVAADTYSSLSWEVVDLNADSILNVNVTWIPKI